MGNHILASGIVWARSHAYLKSFSNLRIDLSLVVSTILQEYIGHLRQHNHRVVGCKCRAVPSRQTKRDDCDVCVGLVASACDVKHKKMFLFRQQG